MKGEIEFKASCEGNERSRARACFFFLLLHMNITCTDDIHMCDDRWNVVGAKK